MARQGLQPEKNHVKTLLNRFLSRSNCSVSPAANLAGTRKKPQTPTDCAPEWSVTVQFAPKKTITVQNYNRLTNRNTVQLYLSSLTEKSDHMLNPFSN
ncbi:hypothetical protein N5C93_01430 [Pseudomonas nitroreducens]|uniref:hypothetical protein n=1 Tax=Pseudomonas nitroreducens TaxID=46680 RepID=UPI000B00B311|nr:hypothetical protein [Pseudomonas nitroreducens]MDH1071484.1 hypothetical protein [Pseudomonas nitroreducens]